MALHEDLNAFCAHAESNSMRIYWSEKCFERNLYREMKHISCHTHVLPCFTLFDVINESNIHGVSSRNSITNFDQILHSLSLLVRPTCFTLFVLGT